MHGKSYLQYSFQKGKSNVARLELVTAGARVVQTDCSSAVGLRGSALVHKPHRYQGDDHHNKPAGKRYCDGCSNDEVQVGTAPVPGRDVERKLEQRWRHREGIVALYDVYVVGLNRAGRDCLASRCARTCGDELVEPKVLNR